MKTTTLMACLAIAGFLQFSSGSADTGPLLLSPMIKNGELNEAKRLSEVKFFQQYEVTAKAYSGYITVNENSQSNLFFLFIEAEKKDPQKPLMLWTQGGPGLSALFGLFLQNGPVVFDAPYNPNNISRRQVTIQKEMNVIYLDAPVGAGFSFAKNPSAYSKTLDDITRDIAEFLKQFLKLFSEYKGRAFFAAGDSYAARYSVVLAEKMLRDQGEISLNLEGIIGGVGFLAPILDLADSSEFLYQTSMLDKAGYDIFKCQFQDMRNIPVKERFPKVVGMLFKTIFANETGTDKTLFQALTSYNSHASPLYTERPLSMTLCLFFLNSKDFKKAIHAGEDNDFQFGNPYLVQNLFGDWLVDIKARIEYVLNHIRVLFYTGQLDALFPSRNLQDYFEKLEWKHATEYRNATRLPWNPYGTSPYGTNYSATGFAKSAGTFTSVVMLGMSHYAAFDKPGETNHLMMQFVSGELSFSSS